MKKSLLIFALSTLFLTSCKDKTAETTANSTESKTVAAVEKTETASFTVNGMSCAVMCASKIEKELAATEGVQKATVDFDKKLATIEYDAAITSPEKLIEKVEAVNGGETYKVSNLKTTADHAMLFQEKEKEKKKSRKQRKADEKAAAEAATTTTSTAKPACCSSKKACSEKKEAL